MSVERLADAVLASGVDLEPMSIVEASQRLRSQVAPMLGAEADRLVVAELLGLGPIQPLVDDPSISDVLVNGPDEVYIECKGRLQRTAVRFRGPDDVLAAIERVLAPLGLRLDPSSPMVDARLPDGSRMSAAMAPACVGGPIIAIRRFTDAVSDLDELLEVGAATPEQVELLRDAVAERWNVLVSGGTGSGKTTLLNLLSKEIPPDQRVVVIEDAAELQLAGHVIRFEGRPPNVEGHGAISIEAILRSALRFRPDRLIVGEVRGPEALDLISALNTGHDGSMATIHANSPLEALWRLRTLAASGARRVAESVIARQLRAALDLVVHLERRDGIRRVARVAKVRS